MQATGLFEMKVIDAITNKEIEKYSNPNLVVAIGKTNLAQLLAGDVSGLKVSKIAFGTNGSDPALTDTVITGVYSKALDGFSYPANGQVRFQWSLAPDENNGMNIAELGLLTSSNILFARKVRSVITKTSAIRLVGTWTISIN